MNTTQVSAAQAPLTDAEIQAMIQAMHNGASISDVTNMDTQTLEGLYSLGYNLYTSGNFQDAQTVFQALCLYKHSETRFWMGLAGCRQANDDLIGAIDAYAMAGMAEGLTDPSPFFYAANCYVRLGDKENAIGALRGLLTMGDESNPAHMDCRTKAQDLLNMLEEKNEA